MGVKETVTKDQSDGTFSPSGLALLAWNPPPKAKSAIETVNNSAALQNDDHLFYAIGANETWIFQGVLYVVAASSTPQFRLAATVPSGASLRLAAVGARSAAADTLVFVYPTAVVSGNAIQIGTSTVQLYPLLVQLWVANGANAGNVQIQWAQWTAHASDTSVDVGSHLIGRRVS